LFREEGRLREHTFWNGSYRDLVVLAVYREVWERLKPKFLSYFEEVPGPPVDGVRA
jgi:hypothetical protein